MVKILEKLKSVFKPTATEKKEAELQHEEVEPQQEEPKIEEKDEKQE